VTINHHDVDNDLKVLAGSPSSPAMNTYGITSLPNSSSHNSLVSLASAPPEKPAAEKSSSALSSAADRFIQMIASPSNGYIFHFFVCFH